MLGLHCYGLFSTLWCKGSLLYWFLLLWSTGSRARALSRCVTWAQLSYVSSVVVSHGLCSCCSRAQAQQSWFPGSGAQAQQSWFLGSRSQAQQSWHTGLVALQQVGSSQTRDGTHVSCTGRQILYTEPPGRPLIPPFLKEGAALTSMDVTRWCASLGRAPM